MEKCIVKTDFYDKFKCIASECDFTCCQEWKIGVDENTIEKWANMIAPSDTQIRHSSMKNIKMDEIVVDSDGESSIALCENGYCPFFNEKQNKFCKRRIRIYHFRFYRHNGL